MDLPAHAGTPEGDLPSRPRPGGRRRVAGPAVAAAVAGSGVPLGLLWAVVAPAVPVLVTGRGPVYADPQPEQLIAADGWFLILALPLGVVAALAVWALVPSVRGVAGLVALTVGMVAAGLLAWWLGRQLGLADYQAALAAAEPGARLERPPDLTVAQARWWPPRVTGVPLAPALAAAVAYTLAAAWAQTSTLRPPSRARG